jgi:hypothetical protein
MYPGIDGPAKLDADLASALRDAATASYAADRN